MLLALVFIAGTFLGFFIFAALSVGRDRDDIGVEEGLYDVEATPRLPSETA